MENITIQLSDYRNNISLSLDDNILDPQKTSERTIIYLANIAAGNHIFKISEKNLLSTKAWFFNFILCFLDSLTTERNIGAAPGLLTCCIDVSTRINVELQIKVIFKEKGEDDIVGGTANIICNIRSKTINEKVISHWLITNIASVTFVCLFINCLFLFIMIVNIMSGVPFMQGGLIFLLLILLFMLLNVIAILKIRRKHRYFKSKSHNKNNWTTKHLDSNKEDYQ